MSNHSNESCWAVLCTVYYAVVYKVVLHVPFKSVDESVMCDHSNESCRALHLCGIVNYAAQGYIIF